MTDLGLKFMKHANCYRCDSCKISASERGTWVCKTLAEYQMVMQVEKNWSSMCPMEASLTRFYTF